MHNTEVEYKFRELFKRVEQLEKEVSKYKEQQPIFGPRTTWAVGTKWPVGYDGEPVQYVLSDVQDIKVGGTD